MKDPSDDGDCLGEPQAKRRREEAAGAQPSARPQQEIGAAVTNRTVRTAASNHVIMSPPNEQQTPTKHGAGCEEVILVPGRESGARTHTKFREGHQKDFQSLSLNGGEGAKDVMILSLQKRLNTSSTEVKLSGQ